MIFDILLSTDADASSSGSNGGPIAGGVIGGLTGLGIAAYLLLQYRNKNNSVSVGNEEMQQIIPKPGRNKNNAVSVDNDVEMQPIIPESGHNVHN